MINQLRDLYPTLLLYNSNEPLNPHYKWFITENHEILGIHVDELSAKEISLLHAFLTPYDIQFPVLTKEEQTWTRIISESHHQDKLEHAYRFVYFSFNRNQITPIQFKSAICDLFGREIPILWESEFEGIIIEEKMMHEEITSYEQIIDVLMSDLYVKIKFFVGAFKDNLKDIQFTYKAFLYAAKIVINHSNKNVTTYTDAVPYILINQTDQDVRQSIQELILQEFHEDDETVKMIETFVACNLNISETAKVLHMHRNSLQYRLDRLYDKTGLDIRQFHHAMTAYLALLAKE